MESFEPCITSPDEAIAPTCSTEKHSGRDKEASRYEHYYQHPTMQGKRTNSNESQRVTRRQFIIYLLVTSLVTLVLAVVTSFLIARHISLPQPSNHLISESEEDLNPAPRYELKLVKSLSPCNFGEALLAQLNGKLFIACRSSNLTHVYDSQTLTYQYDLIIPTNLRSPRQIIANPAQSSIYIILPSEKTAADIYVSTAAIWKADLNSENITWELWSDSPSICYECKLSIAHDGSVKMFNQTSLMEFDTDGNIISTHIWYGSVKSNTRPYISHSASSCIFRPGGMILIHVSKGSDYLMQFKTSASMTNISQSENDLNNDLKLEKINVMDIYNEGAILTVIEGPEDYVFYASYKGTAQIGMADMNLNKYKVIGDHERHGLVRAIRSMSYDPVTKRLVVAEAFYYFWWKLAFRPLDVVKIFDVVAA